MLENRLIKEWKPTGNVKLKRTDRYCYLRCRLDIPYPVLEVANEPAPGHAVNVGPLGSRALAGELADQLTSLYRLRHCGRKLKVREHPSAYGQMGRCVSPCLGDLDPNAYRRQLDMALAHFEAPGAGERLIEEIDERMREARRGGALRARCRAAAPPRPARLGARAARRRAARHAHRAQAGAGAAPGEGALRRLLDRPGPAGGLGAAPGRVRAGRAHRGRTVASPGPRPIPANEIDEVRIVASWIAEHEPPTLKLDPAPAERRSARLHARGRRRAGRAGGRGRRGGLAAVVGLPHRPLGRLEADLRVGLVAEGLRGRGAAAA